GVQTCALPIFHRYNFKNACTWHEFNENADVYMVYSNYERHYRICFPCFNDCVGIDDDGPVIRCTVLYNGQWRHGHALGKLILGLGTSRSIYRYLASVWDLFRDYLNVCTQKSVWI